ncbi:hypothetical protein [Nocardia sp. IFM 10818]
MSIVHITGTIDHGGHFTPGWWGSAPDDARPPPGPVSGWTVLATDESGRVLALAPAAIEQLVDCPGSGAPLTRLDAFLPLARESAYLVVRHDEVETYRRPVPAPAAVSLDLTAVEGARLTRDRTVRIPVRIDGPRPPSGAHLVARWETTGSGDPAVPLGLIDVGGGDPAVVPLPLAELPAAGQCRLTVSYSDGARTVTVSSPVLDVERRPAYPRITPPEPNAARYDDGLLVLEGQLDGDGDPAALHWRVDGEPAGTGPRAVVSRPSAGTHTVSLEYGPQRDQIEVSVSPTPAAERQSSLWTPPWRTGPVRSIGAPLE